MRDKRARALALLMGFLISGLAGANEPFQATPELIGLKRVVLVTSFGINIDRATLEHEVRSRLEAAGIQVVEGADLPTLHVDVITSPFQSSLCPGLISLQVRLTLREPVTIRRSPALRDVKANTWTAANAAEVVSKDDAASLAVQSAQYLVDGFVYNVTFSTKGFAK